ncbi:response regulator [Desulforhopalus singaporensis]|uniref:Response regulator receiver domain-containing protein n=1 Tax=Desulforhopalus singaporensis TaxID=91360 RepID=A0A1H0PEB6_9BACT|nr:response regulator [Desulforhopalus singaporensis]SDP03351.1 Response regulator receiver domain-containing protein [Desulforhopalus singaporensis]
MKILIIDDDHRTRDLFKIWLEKENFEVLEAANGLEGMKAQQKHRADMLICDLIMPVQEGIETISLFRENYPQVGIIAISGGGQIGSESYLQMAEILGAWRVFAKPLDMTQIVQAVHEWQKGLPHIA